MLVTARPLSSRIRMFYSLLSFSFLNFFSVYCCSNLFTSNLSLHYFSYIPLVCVSPSLRVNIVLDSDHMFLFASLPPQAPHPLKQPAVLRQCSWAPEKAWTERKEGSTQKETRNKERPFGRSFSRVGVIITHCEEVLFCIVPQDDSSKVSFILRLVSSLTCQIYTWLHIMPIGEAHMETGANEDTVTRSRNCEQILEGCRRMKDRFTCLMLKIRLFRGDLE